MKKILYTAICACSILCGAQAQTPGSEVPNLKKLYELTDSCDVNVRARFSPLIGISASISNGASRVGATYIQSIVKAGELRLSSRLLLTVRYSGISYRI